MGVIFSFGASMAIYEGVEGPDTNFPCVITDIGDNKCEYSHQDGNEYNIYDWSANITVNGTMIAQLDCYDSNKDCYYCKEKYVIGTLTTCWKTRKGIYVGDACCSQDNGLMIAAIVCISVSSFLAIIGALFVGWKIRGKNTDATNENTYVVLS
jgi:hypothetical protein